VSDFFDESEVRDSARGSTDRDEKSYMRAGTGRITKTVRVRVRHRASEASEVKGLLRRQKGSEVEFLLTKSWRDRRIYYSCGCNSSCCCFVSDPRNSSDAGRRGVFILELRGVEREKSLGFPSQK